MRLLKVLGTLGLALLLSMVPVQTANDSKVALASIENIKTIETIEEAQERLLGTTKDIMGDKYTAVLTDKGVLYWDNGNTPDALIINAINEMNVDPRMSDYLKCVTINDYLRKVLDYDKEAAKVGITADWNPWMIWCLSDGQAVCAGYTESFQKLCLANGIECWYDVGYLKNEPIYHAWNKVVIANEEYYVDVTFNDQNNESVANQFLMNKTLFDDRTIEKEVKTYSINSDKYPYYDGSFIIKTKSEMKKNY